ncbi:MAG: BsuBI/PstI family type II restriction endonuclease [Rothia sp. (in: high G+C Gram-positive bacteria)]|uniref:BsuBI/PstI family type II restriction endonuclease n=1 Tax=Rothia sp. (in: high G+C Gram-positive bacteria) TaxID=1885016 RepID=UPI0026E0C22D|nr:BsuBI/PstI family type II restriction endonuclease [Rothia sp. (in: high G+C Gram-positive bacteria)]MDO5750208.1 BsuBI/PstI family type II restriction endonuclease [Rothia sp. (in: high G+C Gram-positive bacteria)]
MNREDLKHNRIEEARIILELIGMDAERSNVRSALVLLALADLTAESTWQESQNPMLGTAAIIKFIEEHYDKGYAPNSRETIRRFTLHQFIEVALVEENPDNPTRPKNSPKWNYRLTGHALSLLKTFGTDSWDTSLKSYITEIPGLQAKYKSSREMARIPLTLPNGEDFSLSPGGQNILIKSIVDDFCPRFTPGGQILYIGDADSKWALFENNKLQELGIHVDKHGKMPDLIVYIPERNWLVLLEAASSHGPVDAKRQDELATLFANSTAGLVYVSCFPDRKEYRKYVDKIAWESEVWCADHPTHMIHYNGERFLGPYS